MARSAAKSLYPHLPSAERPEQAQGGPIATVMWPSLVREREAKEAAKRKADPAIAREQYAGGVILAPALHLLGGGRR
jgi:hypothetical protein